MIYDKADEIIEKHFETLLKIYQTRLETSMKSSDFIFDCFCLLYYKCREINLNGDGSYIDSRSWIKTKKATKHSVNYDNKCFEYAVTVALNQEDIGKSSHRKSKIKPFINKYNWKVMNNSSGKDN